MTRSYFIDCKVGEDCVVATDCGKIIKLKKGQKVRISLSEIISPGIDSVKIIFKKDGESHSSFVPRGKIIAPGGARVIE